MTPKEAIQHAKEALNLKWTDNQQLEPVAGVVNQLVNDLESPDVIVSTVQALWLPLDQEGARERPSAQFMLKRLSEVAAMLTDGEASVAWAQLVAWAALRVKVETDLRVAAAVFFMRSIGDWSNVESRRGRILAELITVAGRSAEPEEVPHAKPYNKFEKWPLVKSLKAPKAWQDLTTAIQAANADVTLLAAAVTTLHGRVATELNANEQHITALKSALQDIENYVLQLPLAPDSTTDQLELIWWGQSLYSPSLNASYRDLPSTARTFWMADDMAELGSIWPSEAKAAYFTETLRRINVDIESTLPLREHAAQLVDAVTHGRKLVPDANIGTTPDWMKTVLLKEPSCLPVTYLIEGSISGAGSERLLQELSEKTGMPLDRQTSHRQWATWAIRERCLLRFLHNAWQAAKE